VADLTGVRNLKDEIDIVYDADPAGRRRGTVVLASFLVKPGMAERARRRLADWPGTSGRA
jgi:hypothetical protein